MDNKQEILIELKEVREKYLESINIDSVYFSELYLKLQMQKIHYGFCFYFNSRMVIIDQLEKDLLKKVEDGHYWYPRPDSFFGDKCKTIQKTLKPRLEHLQRTINRLENELKNQPTI